MSDAVLLLEVDDGVATVTLNRPRAMNALSAQLRRELEETFVSLAGDATVDVAILTGAGERAFSAGLDLKELANGPAAGDAATLSPSQSA
jgi:enoyl-CoA hydratase